MSSLYSKAQTTQTSISGRLFTGPPNSPCFTILLITHPSILPAVYLVRVKCPSSSLSLSTWQAGAHPFLPYDGSIHGNLASHLFPRGTPILSLPPPPFPPLQGTSRVALQAGKVSIRVLVAVTGTSWSVTGDHLGYMSTYMGCRCVIIIVRAILWVHGWLAGCEWGAATKLFEGTPPDWTRRRKGERSSCSSHGHFPHQKRRRRRRRSVMKYLP